MIVAPRSLGNRVAGIYAVLIATNAAAWAAAFLVFHDHPVLLGTAVVAYTFGLRHAVDADHIAAIDNVTRKLMQDEDEERALVEDPEGLLHGGDEEIDRDHVEALAATRGQSATAPSRRT